MEDEHLHGGGDIAHTFVNITTAKKAYNVGQKMCVRRRHYVPDIDKKKKNQCRVSCRPTLENWLKQ
jgi:hypothetical protein